MSDRSRDGLVGLGSTLAALGGGLLVYLLSRSTTAVPWWQWTLGWTGLSVGLLILLTQAVPALESLATLPFRRMKSAQMQKRVRNARYRQKLRCMPQGHVFEEVVRQTSDGWLEYEGAVRTCPVCGNAARGFESLGVVPLNKAAEKGRFL